MPTQQQQRRPRARGGSIASVARRVGQKLDAARVAVTNAAINAGYGQDDSARPTFPGERHVLLRLKNGKLGQGNWIGPGTHVIERLRRGDPARTPVDGLARQHDIDYARAAAIEDPLARGEAVRAADIRMRRGLDEIQRAGSDAPMNIALGHAITAKNAAEDLGLLRRDAFQGFDPQLAAAVGSGRVKARGTREEVYHGIAKKTSGGLKKGDIEKRGSRYVSKAASKVAKARFNERCGP